MDEEVEELTTPRSIMDKEVKESTTPRSITNKEMEKPTTPWSENGFKHYQQHTKRNWSCPFYLT
jgi:hypothetical protein